MNLNVIWVSLQPGPVRTAVRAAGSLACSTFPAFTGTEGILQVLCKKYLPLADFAAALSKGRPHSASLASAEAFESCVSTSGSAQAGRILAGAAAGLGGLRMLEILGLGV